MWESPSSETRVLYSIDRKIENFITHIFTSVVMPPNFILFSQKIGFKSALGGFSSLCEHLRIALAVHGNNSNNMNNNNINNKNISNIAIPAL